MSLKDMLTSKDDFYFIPLENIKEDPDLPYRADMGDLDDLAMNIAQNGLEYPLIVRVSEKKNHVLIVDGIRRFRAINIVNAKNLSFTGNIYDAKCLLECKGTDDITRHLKLLITGTYHKQLNVDEQADIIYKLVHKYKITTPEIATRLGQPERVVWQLLCSRRVPSKDLEQKIAQLTALMLTGGGFEGIEHVKRGLELALGYWDLDFANCSKL